MTKDTYYNFIGSRYIKPINEENGLLEMEKARNELNEHLDKKQRITYREYFDILQKYYTYADYPGCFWDILDDPIPVKGFYWSSFEAYSNMKYVNNKWIVDENTKCWTWTLRPIELA